MVGRESSAPSEYVLTCTGTQSSAIGAEALVLDSPQIHATETVHPMVLPPLRKQTVEH